MSATDPAEGLGAREPITNEELALAARNHGMPLEGLRYDITPVGMHYLLIHFDIPAADARRGRSRWAAGSRGRSRSRSPTSVPVRRSRCPVTMECAGNGRARLDPRPAQPAVARRGDRDGDVDGNAARPDPGGGGPGPMRSRSSSVERITASRAASSTTTSGASRSPTPCSGRGDPRVRAERPAAAAATRLPGSTAGARLVRHDQREVAPLDHRGRRAVRRVPDVGVPAPAARGGRGNAGHADDAAGADDPAGIPRLLHAVADRRRRHRLAGGTCVVRMGDRLARRGQRGRRRVVDGCPPVGARRRRTHGERGRTDGRPSPASTS